MDKRTEAQWKLYFAALGVDAQSEQDNQFNDMLDLQALAERFIETRRKVTEELERINRTEAQKFETYQHYLERYKANDPTLAAFYEPQDQGDG